MKKIHEKDTLRQQIAVINKKLLEKDFTNLPIGLFHGKMGICLYSYYLARKVQDKEYEYWGQKLLEEIYSGISNNISIDFDSGLAGIGWAINYLIKEKYLKGNINIILKDIDDQIFKTISFSWLEKEYINLSDFIKIIYYLIERLEIQKKGSYEEYFFQQLIIKLINHISLNVTEEQWKEPLKFSLEYPLSSYLLVLSRLFELNFYNYKISKVLDELSSIVLSTFPLLHVHRLSLFLGIRSVFEQTFIPDWQEHADFLFKGINHNKILYKELRNKNIKLGDGIAGYVLLLKLLDKSDINNHFQLFKQEVYNRIEASDCWSDDFIPDNINDMHIGLWYGFVGISWILDLLE